MEKTNGNELYYVHSFIYDLDYIEKIKEKLQKIEFKDDFLVTFDKIFRDIEFDNTEYIPAKLNVNLYDREFVVTDGVKIFEIYIESAQIYFFTNEIAFFVLKIRPLKENLSKEELYYLNYLLSSFYKFEDEKEVYIAPLNGKKFDIKIFNNIKKYDPKNPMFPFIESENPLESDFDKSRVGFLKNEEKEKIEKLLEKECYELHYRPVCEIIDKIKHDDILVNYDTFITGFFIEYVKINKSYNYYDNFNPLGVNFLFMYGNIYLSQEELEQEFENGFKNYEPLLTYSKYNGMIKMNSFYKVYQPDSDIFIIGNQNNVVNFINKDSKCYETIISYMKKHKNSSINKELIIYLYVLFQNVYLMMLSSMFVVDYNKEKHILKVFKRYKDNVKYIDDAIHKYNSYIVNHNFNSISDNPFLNNVYQFFRKLREIQEKQADVKLIVGQYNNLKNIVKNVSQSLGMFVVAMMLLVFFLKILNMASNFLIDEALKFINFLYHLFV